MKSTPNYIRNLLLPTTKSPQARRVWGVDLETVWLPFLTATNLMGDTAIPLDALGAPLRLAYDKDGSIRFGRNGRPVTRVAKPISSTVTLIRENFVANLQQYAEQVADTHNESYANQLRLQREAGEPIIQQDKAELDKAIQLQIEATLANAEAPAGEVSETQNVERERVPA